MGTVRRWLGAQLAADAAVRAAIDDAWEVTGDPRLAVPLEVIAAAVVTAAQVPHSLALERRIRSALGARGARVFRVGNRPLVRGVRRRGQPQLEALASSREWRAWARGETRRP